MHRVSNNYARGGTNAQRKSVRDSAPRPGLLGKISKQRQRSFAHRNQFLADALPVAFVCTRRRDVRSWIKSRQRLRLASSESHRAARLNSFDVRDVSDHFGHRPFAGRIAKAREGLGDFE